MSPETADVVIIGTGFGGAIPGYHLAAGGARVVFLERGPRMATGDFTHERCMAALDAVASACRKHGKHWGAVTPTSDYAALVIDKGCTLVSAVNDVKLVATGLDAMKEAFSSVW